MTPAGPRSVVIVGASLAGLSAARALRAQGYDGTLTLVGEERHRPYDRPPLSKGFLTGAVTEPGLALLDETEQGDPTSGDTALSAEWLLGRRAVALDADRRAVTLDDGTVLTGDAVVLATGARARQLTGTPAGVHTVRTLDDAVALRDHLARASSLVVVGAGFIGGEVASSGRSLGLDVTVVEAAATPLAVPLGEPMGAACGQLHGDHGVRLLTGHGVVRLHGDDDVEAVELADGTRLPADVVVVGIGAVQNVEWLAGSGLEAAAGVVTDAACRTGAPGVLAVGDCALSYDLVLRRHARSEHWTHALQQPSAAAATLLGQPQPHRGVPYFWSEQYGRQIQVAGTREPGDTVEIVHGSVEDRSFVATYSTDGRLSAVLGVGATAVFTRYRRQLRAAYAEAVDDSRSAA